MENVAGSIHHNSSSKIYGSVMTIRLQFTLTIMDTYFLINITVHTHIYIIYGRTCMLGDFNAYIFM